MEVDRMTAPLPAHALTSAYAAQCDGEDPLRSFRNRFYMPHNQIYMDGNSLGLASKDAEAALLNALADWKHQAIDGWMSGTRPWFYYAEELGKLQADLVGALPDELVVTGTTTVNLHSLAATFYRPHGKRTKILADSLNFPSDIYALQSQVRLHGYDPAAHLLLSESLDSALLSEAALIEQMTDEVALVLLPSVLYRSGQLLDLQRLTQAAHDRGIPIGFDCCHSAGILPHALHDWGVDFAFWCSYKYLNGGPGAIATLFVHQKHFGTLPGMTGWFGSDKVRQFDMSLQFTQASNAGAWQIGTPPILASAPLYGSLQIFAEAGIDRIRAKSLDLTRYLIFLIDHRIADAFAGFRLGCPRSDAQRGGHVALHHPDAARICKALKARGVTPDFRTPDVIRLAPVPLYNSYTEVWQSIETLRAIMASEEHLAYSAEREIIA
jgi:kynureninase